MNIYAHIKRCLELSDREIASAIADRRLTKALLEQLAAVSKPSDGGPKLLLFFAKLAAEQPDWFDGALRVEMTGEAGATTVDVLCELGAGMHERVVPSFKMNVPLEELARAVERVPHMVAPLRVATSSEQRLILTAGELEVASSRSAPTSNVSIADDSLYKRPPSREKLAAVRPTAPPKSTRPPRRSTHPPASSHAAHSTKPPSHDPKRAVVARVPLTRIQVPRAAVEKGATGAPPRVTGAPPASKRPSKPPKKVSVRPSAAPKKSSKPPGRPPTVRPPARPSSAPKSKRGAATEPPDDDSVDRGWEDDS